MKRPPWKEVRGYILRLLDTEPGLQRIHGSYDIEAVEVTVLIPIEAELVETEVGLRLVLSSGEDSPTGLTGWELGEALNRGLAKIKEEEEI